MTGPPTVDCGRVRPLLGVSVLGLTEPDEEQLVQDHIRQCADCAAARAELEIVVPLLATVSVDDATAGLPEPRPELLKRVIAETRAETRLDTAGRRRRRLAAGIAGFGLAAAAAVLVVAAPWQAESPTHAPQAASTLVATAVDPSTGVRGQFSVTSAETGSDLWMSLSGVRPGDSCHLVAEGAEGGRQVTASWIVGADGTATLNGHTSWQAQDIAALKVVDQDGRVLVQVSQADLKPAE